MTRFDHTGVKLTVHGNNSALGVNVLSDSNMRGLGFTDPEGPYWYLHRRVSEDGRITLYMIIAKDGSDWLLDVVDARAGGFPYDYQWLLKQQPSDEYAQAVADECERQYRLLTESGILTGWYEGMWV